MKRSNNIAPAPIAMDVQVPGSGTDGGGGGGDDSVSRDAEKEVVTVPPDPIVASNC